MSIKTQLYMRNGRDFSVTSDDATEIHTKLPVGIYRLASYPFVGWVFERIDDFNLPLKLYGDLSNQADRILKTYKHRLSGGHSTGVLLHGDKGAGKTLLAKKVANDSDLPAIVINQAFYDDSFKELIAGLGECVVIFDEFEKVYSDADKQNALLTLFDGVFNVQALMFVIVNERTGLVGPLLNRPGRLYYSLEYRGLDKKFIQDYCEDRLDNQDGIIGVLSVATMFLSFNFDMLQALVEEMNRYKELASDAVKYLNIQNPYEIINARYKVQAFDMTNEREYSLTKQEEIFRGSPIGGGGAFVKYIYTGKKLSDDEEECKEIYVTYIESNLVGIDPVKEVFIYEYMGTRVILTKDNGMDGFVLGNTMRLNYDRWNSERQFEECLEPIKLTPNGSVARAAQVYK